MSTLKIVSLLHSTSIHFHWLIREQTDGCSGAEITSLCQEAAILTMQNNMSALYVSPIYPSQFLLLEYDQVPHDAFVTAAKRMTRQITPAVLQKYIKWGNGFHS
jgi:AAA family ATPase